MTETTRENLGYLGVSFQQKVLWQLLTVPEFAEYIIPSLTASYFDNQHHKYIMSMIKKYHEENGKPANLLNRSIYEFVRENTKNEMDKELIIGVLNQIVNFDRDVLFGKIYSDSDVVQKKIWLFVKEQEAKKIAFDIIDKVKTGDLEENVLSFEEKFKMIMNLGIQPDQGESVHHDAEDALRENYREPIQTGIKVMDAAMAGGLGKGEMGIALMPYGIGKTTFLCKAANTAYEEGKHVLQIFFEDNKSDVKRKHYAIWSKTPLSEIESKRAYVLQKQKEKEAEHIAKGLGGSLILKKWKTEDGAPTIPNIEKWILNYQKLFGIKFDILFLDYLDCCESHKQTHGDTNQAELIIAKAFESMLSDLNIPGWTAVQGNRAAIRSEYVHGDQMGGSIKRAQKTHFLFSVAKSQEQKQDNLANIQIIKSRMTKDGQMYENAIYNNDTLEIKCIEGIRPSTSKDKKSDAVNSQLYDPLIQNAINMIVDEQVRKNNEIIAKNIVENNLVDNQEDKKKEVVSHESVI